MSHLRTASSRRRGIHASTISSSRLRMDTHGGPRGNSRGRSPRHKEIDRVMKKGRNDSGPQSSYWTKKSLEAEEKDPYRSARDRSRSNHNRGRAARDRSRSPRGRSRTPRDQSRSLRDRSRDKRDLSRSRGQPSTLAAHLGRHGPRVPRSPPPERRATANSHSSNRHRGRSSSKTRAPPSPPLPTRSSSSSNASSVESCSNESCSVCSPRRDSEAPIRHHHSPVHRSRSFSVPRSAAERVRSPPNPAPPPKRKKMATSSGTHRTLAHGGGVMSSRVAQGMSQGEVKRARAVTGRALEGNGAMHKISRSMHESGRGEAGRVREGSRGHVDEPQMDSGDRRREGRRPRAKSPRSSQRSGIRDPVSSASSDSESDSESASQSSDGDSTPRLPYSSSTLTLSERFGRMAQWSVDRREYDSVRMKITKDSHSSGKKVVIEGGASLSPPPSSIDGYIRGSYNNDSYNRPGTTFNQSLGVLHHSPVPEYGHSPYRLGRRDDSPSGTQAGGGTGISAVIPEGTIGDWDDVHVRYRYYRDRGYFWDMGLEEYAKWEEWWAKYQEWLEMERYYDQVAQHREWAAAAAAATAASGWPSHVGRNYARRNRGRSRDDRVSGDAVGDMRQGKGSRSGGGVWAGEASSGGRKRRR